MLFRFCFQLWVDKRLKFCLWKSDDETNTILGSKGRQNWQKYEKNWWRQQMTSSNDEVMKISGTVYFNIIKLLWKFQHDCLSGSKVIKNSNFAQFWPIFAKNGAFWDKKCNYSSSRKDFSILFWFSGRYSSILSYI